MSGNAILGGTMFFSQFGVDAEDFPPDPPAPTATPVGHIEMHEHSPSRTILENSSLNGSDVSDSRLKFVEIKEEKSTNGDGTNGTADVKKEIEVKFETLRSYDGYHMDVEASRGSGGGGPGVEHSMDGSLHEDSDHSVQHARMMVTPDLAGMMAHHSQYQNGIALTHHPHQGPKTWTQEDMEMALDALRNHNMSLTKPHSESQKTQTRPPNATNNKFDSKAKSKSKASATYGIPSTTLWQRAHRLGIDTPKKEGSSKNWTEENLNNALDALRTGTISANKASKAFGIPSSTLYKIARREGIRLAAPFNAAPTTWSPEDLEKALESIRSGQTSVQRASTEYGIPTGTLYGRCKREGIELSRSNPTPWSEDAMGEALEAVRLGHMSINQAAIHYNLPYSSLYGRFKRGIKYDMSGDNSSSAGGGGGGGAGGGGQHDSDSNQHLHHQHHLLDDTSFDYSSQGYRPPS